MDSRRFQQGKIKAEALKLQFLWKTIPTKGVTISKTARLRSSLHMWGTSRRPLAAERKVEQAGIEQTKVQKIQRYKRATPTKQLAVIMGLSFQLHVITLVPKFFANICLCQQAV